MSNASEVNAQCFSVKQLLKASINISAIRCIFQSEMYSYTTYEPTLMKFYKPRDFTLFYYIIDDIFFDWILITFTSSISHTLLSSDLTVFSSKQTSSKDSWTAIKIHIHTSSVRAMQPHFVHNSKDTGTAWHFSSFPLRYLW